MIITILVLFAFTNITSLIRPGTTDRTNLIMFWLIGSLLLLFAGFRDGESFMDYDNYVVSYNTIDDILTEPSFILISNLVRVIFNNVIFLFLIYAALGVTLKLIAIRKLSNLCFLSLIIYVSFYYILHELTQIRAGVAAALILLTIQPIYDRNLKHFLVLAVLACSFHISAIIVFPLWFLKSDKIYPYTYILLIGLCYLFVFFKIDIIETIINFIPIERVNDKFTTYKQFQAEQMRGLDSINIFNKIFLLKCFLYFILLVKSNILIEKNKYSYLLLKIYGISLALFLVFSSMPIFAARTSELLGVVEVILIPMFYYIIKSKALAKISISIYAISMILVTIFYNKLIL